MEVEFKVQDNTYQDNIYNICYNALLDILEIISLLDNIESKPKGIMDFLLGKNPSFDMVLDSILDDSYFNDTVVDKAIMILIIAEKSYLLNLYNNYNDINADYCAECIEQLEGLNVSEIIALFYSDKEFAFNIVMDFIDYTNQSFIFESFIKNDVLNSEKKHTLFKINPLSIFELGYFVPIDELLPSEVVIQKIVNIYDRSVVYIQENQESELLDYEDKDQFLVTKFIDFLEEYCKEEKTFYEVIQFMFANIYEYVFSYGNKPEIADEYHFIRETVENNSPLELINKFMSDYRFAENIIEIFVNFNACLQEYDLMQRREEFKNKKGDVKRLQRLNHFYNDEEKKFNKQKESRSN